jgi:hypothetical protein
MNVLKRWIPRFSTLKKTKRKQKKTRKLRHGGNTPFPRNNKNKNDYYPPKKRGPKLTEKMNCHPAVENRTVHEKSCFTSDSIVKIKEAYNRGHPNDRIVATQPRKIWEDLNQKLSHCKREDCWLQEIKEPTIKKQMEEYFSPKHPKDWLKNPNEWLSDRDILAVLKQYEQKFGFFEFIGPAMIDFDTKLPEENDNCVENRLCQFSLSEKMQRGKKKIGIIFNLDDHTQDGSHWVSMFIDIPEKIIFYFDSAGNEIPLEIKRFKERVMKQGVELADPIHFRYYDNEKKDHQKGFTECGMYSLFFIVTMLTCKIDFLRKMESPVGSEIVRINDEVEAKSFDKNMSLEKRIKFFQSGKIHDKYVEKYRKIYFNSPS